MHLSGDPTSPGSGGTCLHYTRTAMPKFMHMFSHSESGKSDEDHARQANQDACECEPATLGAPELAKEAEAD